MTSSCQEPITLYAVRSVNNEYLEITKRAKSKNTTLVENGHPVSNKGENPRNERNFDSLDKSQEWKTGVTT